MLIKIILFLIFYCTNSVLAQELITDTFAYPVTYCKNYILTTPQPNDFNKPSGYIITDESLFFKHFFLKHSIYLSTVSRGFFHLEPVNSHYCDRFVFEDEPFYLKFINVANTENIYLGYLNNNFILTKKDEYYSKSIIFKFKKVNYSEDQQKSTYVLFHETQDKNKIYLTCDSIRGCYGQTADIYPFRLSPVMRSTYEKADTKIN